MSTGHAVEPRVGEVVKFLGYCDKVTGQFVPGQFLTVTLVYGPDSEWWGGFLAVDTAGVSDFVWAVEVGRRLEVAS